MQILKDLKFEMNTFPKTFLGVDMFAFEYKCRGLFEGEKAITSYYTFSILAEISD